MTNPNTDHPTILDQPSNHDAFTPDAAAYFSNPDNHINTEINDTGDTITVTAEDDDGNNVILEYGLNQVLVSIATYEQDAEEIDVTTPPEETHRYQVYPDDPEYNTLGKPVTIRGRDPSESLILNGAPATFPEAVTELWDRSMLMTPEADFITLSGIDDADDPTPNEYDCNFVLKKGYFEATPHSPFFVHPELNQ